MIQLSVSQVARGRHNRESLGILTGLLHKRGMKQGRFDGNRRIVNAQSLFQLSAGQRYRHRLKPAAVVLRQLSEPATERLKHVIEHGVRKKSLNRIPIEVKYSFVFSNLLVKPDLRSLKRGVHNLISGAS